MSELDPSTLPPQDQRQLVELVQTELAGELDQLETLHTDDSVVAFARIFAKVPNLPGAAVIERALGRRLTTIGPFFEGNPLQRVRTAVHTADGLFRGMGMRGGTDATATEISYGRLQRTFAGGDIDRVVKELGRVRGTVGDNIEYYLLPHLPLVLLHVATNALWHNARAERAQTGPLDAMVHQQIDDQVARQLQTACAALIEQEKLQIPGPDTPARAVAISALRMLNQCSLMGNSNKDKLDLVKGLLPLYYREVATNTGTLDLAQRRECVVQYVTALQAFGIDTGTSEPPFNLSHEQLTAIYTRYADSSRQVGTTNVLHARLGARFYGDALIMQVAGGDINYVNLLNATTLADSQPLSGLIDHRAAQAEARKIEEEEVRLREVGRLQALGWQPLRRTERRSDAGPDAEEEGGPLVSGKRQKRIPELDDYRLAALGDIKDMFPGAEIWHRPLKTGRKTQEANKIRRKDDVDSPEEYYVLVIPRRLADGTIGYDAIAECAEVSTAAYLWLAEWGMDAAGQVVITWETVFDNNRPDAKKYGAVDLRHPRKSERLRNPARAAGRFRNRLLDALTSPFQGTSTQVGRQETNYILHLGQREVGGVLNFVGIRGLARRLAAVDESRRR